MRPKQPERTDQDDLFKTRLDTFINLKHEFVQLADRLDWDWIDEQLADCFSDQGRPAEPVRFMIGMLMLKEIYIAILQFACARLTVSLARALLKTKGASGMLADAMPAKRAIGGATRRGTRCWPAPVTPFPSAAERTDTPAAAVPVMWKPPRQAARASR